MNAVALVLAAGEGTRMRSDLPKVAHAVLGVPMVQLVIDAAREAGCDCVVVTGHKAEIVEPLLDDVACVRQECQLGTAHAVVCAREAVSGVSDSLVILSGDTPLVRPETIRSLVECRRRESAEAVLLTARMEDPTGYGRIVRSDAGEVVGIVEHKDASADQLAIDEVNTGIYCFDAKVLFEHLDRVGTDNAQGEFYLTDVISLIVAEGLSVVAIESDEPEETMGVNSRVQLAEATAVLQSRINRRHMLAGVTMTDPSLVWIAPGVEIGRDVLIEPMTQVMGSTSIGARAHIGPNCRIEDSVIAEGACIDSSVVLSARVGPEVVVGPFAYLRPGAVLERGAKAGTCVEIKNSTVGENSKVPHLSYIGDATIGRDVNVGAGTITCNYDGKNKHRTTINDGAFLGSDTMLVAPVNIGKRAVTAAGSAITGDVPDEALGIERSDMRIVDNWAARRKRKSEQ
ncbi:MAG: bifunctional UDP-N-acetylglucosamine diphosphorylase/glucosamine-1-phosphate N-acetyltransferase GlmU [Actinobacteria bacterium]|nr:bifunctional UDP-N-acetylglucosamine diphosphorylase/glucosamine-1-phosphate N-acetyltransferase GlmU [Actinomycetota bacterium]